MKWLDQTLKYSGAPMSNNQNGCLILMWLSLSQKPGIEGEVDYLISIYSDFYIVYVWSEDFIVRDAY